MSVDDQKVWVGEQCRQADGVESKLHSVADGLFLTHDQAQQGALATAIGACSSTRVSECVEDQKVWIGW